MMPKRRRRGRVAAQRAKASVGSVGATRRRPAGV